MFRGHVFMDWDDTIAKNIHLFHEADRRNGLFLSQLFGVSVDDISRQAAALDLKVSRQVGLGRDSYPTAWAACYDLFCARTGRRPREDERARVRATAEWAYEQPQPLVEGAGEVLAALRREGYELTVWTAGDPAVQRRKVEESGLAGVFHRQSVMSKKDMDGLLLLMGDRDPARCVVVGNSAASDIRPALQAGILALHIPAETWAFDEADLDLADPRYVRLESIRLVPPTLRLRLPLAG